MKRKLRIVFILSVLAIIVPHSAEAQFWKRLFKKHKPKEEENKIKTTSQAGNESKSNKEFQYPGTQMKAHYRVDILVPLYLNEIIPDNNAEFNGKVPERASTGIEFFKGVKLAADSLNKLHQHLDIFVHDVADTFKTLDFLIGIHEFDASDLIIGAVQSRDISVIANYANKNHINFISALSPSDGGISNNPYFTLLQPSLHGHCEWIKENISKRFAEKKILLLYRSSVSLDQSAFDYIANDDKGISFQKLRIDLMPDNSKLKPMLDSAHLNVIVMPVLDVVYAEKVLKNLYADFPTYQFEVYGMPSWKNMASLRKAEAFPNVSINITEPFYFEHTSKHARYVEKMYRKEFGGKSGEMAFRGYETLFWYADILKKYGTIFNNKTGDNSNAPFTKFKVKPILNKNKEIQYNENTHLYLYKYDKGALHVEQ